MLLLCIGAAACHDPAGPNERPLSVFTDGANLTLANGNRVPIFYSVVNPDILALANSVFMPCNDPTSSCPRVSPGGTIRMPYGEIPGYQGDESTIAVSQWRLIPNSDGKFTVTDFRSFTVSLRH